MAESAIFQSAWSSSRSGKTPQSIARIGSGVWTNFVGGSGTAPGSPQASSSCARSRGAAIAVAPTLQGVPDDLAKRAARLRANGVVVPALQAADAAAWLLTAGALLAGWTWGLVALAAYCLQPYLIFTGTPLRPRDLHACALLRPLHHPWTWARTAAGRWRSAAEDARARAFHPGSARPPTPPWSSAGRRSTASTAACATDRTCVAETWAA